MTEQGNSAGKARPSIADQVSDALQARILTLDLKPGARISEAEIAEELGVSRQPVRDAFYRLSRLGFVTIRPQRATTISQISVRAVQQARFIRTALEVETVRVACTTLDAADFAALDRIVTQQADAVAQDARDEFHRLDDLFHSAICARAGLGFGWEIVREHKAHMDRVRYMSLTLGSQAALTDHRDILTALRARNPDAAALAMRHHLGRIDAILRQEQARNATYFGDDPARE